MIPAQVWKQIIADIDNGLSVRSICNKYNVSRYQFYLTLKNNPIKKNNNKNPQITKPVVNSTKLDPQFRKQFIEDAMNNDYKITSICKKYGISRFNYYKWLKRYKQAENDPKKAFNNQFVSGIDHWKYIPEYKIQNVLKLVITHPEYSVHRLQKEYPQVGHHGIQNILERRGLATFQDRFSYSQMHKEHEILPSSAQSTLFPIFNISLRVYRMMLAPFIAIPKRLNLPSYIYSYFFSTFFVSFFGYLYFTQIILKADNLGQLLGFAFASISLVFGMFFFLYSMKYYTTIALVLGFSRQGIDIDTQVEKGGQEEEFVKKRGFIQMLFGKKGYQPQGYRGGLLPDLSKIQLKRKPFVSIHLATYNERRVIDRLLTATTSMEYENYEVILVDDSNDPQAISKVKEWIGHPRLKIVHRKNRNGYKGAALEVARKMTNPKAEFILVLDADFIPYPDSITQFLKYFKAVGGWNDRGSISRNPKIAAVQGYQWHVLNKSENWITRGVRSEYAGSYVVERSGTEIYGGLKQISGSVYMLKREVIDKIGWGTSITEDFELTLRLYESGYKVVYTPYIQAPSECVSTIKRLIRQRMRWAEGHSFNIKRMFKLLITSANITKAEKFEFAYLSPYYLQSAFFVIGTMSWFIAEVVFRTSLPIWTAVWGWSLVLTNMFALPLMNMVGMFLEESEERDYLGLFSFTILSYLLAPFQAYASLKGFMEKEEGPWFRTPKTGRITDIFERGRFYRWLSGFLPFKPSVNPVQNKIGLPSLAYSFRNQEDGVEPFNPYLALATANNSFEENRPFIQPRQYRLIGRAVVGGILAFSILLVSLSPYIDAVPKVSAASSGNILVKDAQASEPEPLFVQDFSWGVLAINTDKTTYIEGEKVNISIGVLDNLGEMVCDADVEVKINHLINGKEDILSTQNGTIQTTPSCNIKALNPESDYQGVYFPKEEGAYEITVIAQTKNGTFQIVNYFKVDSNRHFDIQRDTSTRIYPYVKQPVILKVIPDKDFKGTVKEYLPLELSVECGDKCIIDEVNSGRVISWNVDWKKGKSYSLSYKYEAPKISPEFFTLGPLSVGQYVDERQWLVAVDTISVGTVTNTTDTDANNTLSFSHTVAAGTDKVLIVTVTTEDSTDADRPVTGINWNTTEALTLSVAQPNNTNNVNAEIWYLINPTATTANVAVTFTGNVTTAASSAINLTGVIQSSPVDTTGGGALTNTASPSHSVTTGTNNSIIISAIIDNVNDTNLLPAQNSLYNVAIGTAARHVGQYLVKTPQGLQAMAYSQGSSTDDWAHAVAAFKPTPPPNITVSGFIRGTDESTVYNCSTDNLTIYVSVNGGANTSGTCTLSTGEYSISVAAPGAAADPVAVFIDSTETPDGTTVTLAADTTSSISNLDIYRDRVVVTHEGGTAITNAKLATADNTDAGIRYSVSAGALTVDSGFEFHVKQSKTYNPGGTITTQGTAGNFHVDDSATVTLDTATNTIAGDVNVDTSATLNMNQSVTINGGDLTSVGTTQSNATGTHTFGATGTISGGGTINFNILATSGSGTTTISSTISTDGDINVGAGTTLNGTGSITVNGGDFIATGASTGIVSMTGGTVLVAGTGGFLDSNKKAWTFNNLTFGDGTIGTTTISSSYGNEITVSGTLTIATSQTLAANNAKIILSGSGTPFSVSGSFTEGSSTISYTNTTSATLTADTYYNLEVNPASGTPTYTLPIGTITVTNNFNLIGTGSATVTAESNDPTLDLNGDFVIGPNATFIASSTGTFTLAGNYSNGGTFTKGTGTLTLDSSSGNKFLAGNMTGTSSFYKLTFNNSNGSWMASNSATIANNFTLTNGTFSAPAQTLTIGANFTKSAGTFNHSLGTVVFDTSSNTSTVTYDANQTFYNLYIATGSKTVEFDETQSTTVAGNFIVDGGTCSTKAVIKSATASNPFDLTVSGNTYVQYATVTDSNSSSGLSAYNANGTGTNTNWTFYEEECKASSSGLSFQRKTFYDDVNLSFWRFSYDGTELDIEYSQNNGSSWTPITSLAYNTNDFSVWYKAIGATEYVFLAVATSNDIVVRRGSLSTTSISWDGTSQVALNGTAATDTYSYPAITLDSSNYIWIGARWRQTKDYTWKVVDSAATADSTWASLTWNSATSINQNMYDSNLYGVIVPRDIQDMSAVITRQTSLLSCQWDDSDGAWENGASTCNAWPLGSSYFYGKRRQITVTNNMGGAALPAAYPVKLALSGADSSDVNSTSDLSCKDVRVGYDNGSTITEIDRDLITCSGSNVTLWFQTQASIAAAGTSASYYLYYGNATADTPPQDLTGIYAPPKDANTVALYHFNENTGVSTMDSSGFGNNGVLENGTTWETGKFNSAIENDNIGNHRVAVADRSSLDIRSGVTIEMFINPNTTIQSGGSGYATILSHGRPNVDRLAYKLVFNKGSGVLIFETHIGGTEQNATATTTTTWTAGTWYHVAATYDGSTKKIYVNGTQQDSDSQTGDLNVSYQTMDIGSWDSQQAFDGVIDSVRISNTARTSFGYAAVSSEPTSSVGSATTRSETSIEASILKGVSRNFSAVADTTNYDVDVIYTDDETSDQLSFNRYDNGTAAWQTEVNLDTSATISYPTLSIDTDTRDLYAIWVDSSGDDIYYRTCDVSVATSECNASGDWVAEVAWKTTGTNIAVTSNYSGATTIFAMWTDSAAATYNVSWDYIIIVPERLLLFLGFAPLIPLIAKRRRKKGYVRNYKSLERGYEKAGF